MKEDNQPEPKKTFGGCDIANVSPELAALNSETNWSSMFESVLKRL